MEKKMKIVILDKASLGEDTPFFVLERFGEVVSYDKSTPEEAITRSKDADVIIINKVKVTSTLMRSSDRLKLVCVFATGFDNIDVLAARELGIAVCNVPGYSTESVAVYTAATVLALCTHLYEYNNYVKCGDYTRSGVPNKLTPVYHELTDKVWGIVGYGNIGRAVGRIAKAFGARVLANKRTPVDDVECVDIDTLCKESDIITVHCPLNDESRGIINSERLSLMKKNVVLVNEARGAVLDEEAVASAVESGTIAAFGCDVYSTEPFGEEHPYYRIKSLDNVLLTPHAAWGSYESRCRCINIIADNIDSYMQGKILNRVDI